MNISGKWMPEILWGAFVLGFISAFIQLFFIRSGLLLIGEETWVAGILLFSWIFFSGIGSYLAVALEKKVNSGFYAFMGFQGLALSPALAYLSIHFLSAWKPCQYIFGNPFYAAVFIVLLLAPVCMLNGILFSFLSQMSGNKGMVSKVYAFESVGTLLAGIYLFKNAKSLDSPIPGILFAGMLCIFTSWTSCSRKLTSPKARLILGMNILFLTALWFGQHKELFTWQNLRHHTDGFKTKELLISNEKTNCTALNIAQNNYQENKELHNISSGETIVTKAVLPGNFTLSGLVVFFFIFIIIYFLKYLQPAGKSIFINGFCCLALEVIILNIIRMKGIGIYEASTTLVTSMMAGMASGYSFTFSNSKNLHTLFSRLLGVQTSIVLFLLLIVYAGDMTFNYQWNYRFLIGMGFLFSLFSGILFSVAIRLEQGSVARIVASTYGADMLGSSIGALIVSVFMIPMLGAGVVLLLILALLLISTTMYRISI